MKQPFTGASDEKGGRALRSRITARFKQLKEQAAQEVLEVNDDDGGKKIPSFKFI
jgi:hypothetical protein